MDRGPAPVDEWRAWIRLPRRSLTAGTGTLMTTFAELGVDQDIVDALASKGIVDAFPIQEQTIPLGLPARTSSARPRPNGQDLGFGIPRVQRLGANPEPV